MRKGFMIWGLLLGLVALPVQSHAAGSVNISLFHNDLAPYGSWTTVSPYGSVWVPAHVGPGWRPYTQGYWTYTDYGWTWVSYEPFGRDTYHYGRWVYDSYQGWVWVPDTVWAPAWVAWHEGDDYVGWAPLPPASRWESSGLVYSSGAVPATSWVFVERPYFLNRHVSTRVVSVTRNVTLLSSTRDVTRFEVKQGKPFNKGLDMARVESSNGRKMVKTYTAQRQNLHTQKRVPASHAMGVERRASVRTKRTETQVANRQQANPSTQEAQKHAAQKTTEGAAPKGNGKSKGKP
jgi:hypothetical protein